jgi:hypothetical protein
MRGFEQWNNSNKTLQIMKNIEMKEMQKLLKKWKNMIFPLMNSFEVKISWKNLFKTLIGGFKWWKK